LKTHEIARNRTRQLTLNRKSIISTETQLFSSFTGFRISRNYQSILGATIMGKMEVGRLAEW
jgi:hypothetical protein